MTHCSMKVNHRKGIEGRLSRSRPGGFLLPTFVPTSVGVMADVTHGDQQLSALPPSFCRIPSGSGTPTWAFHLTWSVGGYLLAVHSQHRRALSAVWSWYAQSADLSRVTPKDSDRHSANQPADLKYRPTTKSHYTQ